jgi:hypothetical protein
MHLPRYGLIASCAAISGCAQDPTRIQPTFVSTTNFATYDCPALVNAINEREPRLLMLARDQTNRRSADIVSGALIGLTPTMLGGSASQEAEIGGLKGELVAIRKSGEEKGCALPPQSAELTAALDPRPVGQRVQ